MYNTVRSNIGRLCHYMPFVLQSDPRLSCSVWAVGMVALIPFLSLSRFILSLVRGDPLTLDYQIQMAGSELEAEQAESAVDGHSGTHASEGLVGQA